MLARHAIALLALGLVVAAGEAAAAPTPVNFKTPHSPGTIVIKTSARQLYFVTAPGRALRYPVAVGRLGKQWTGTSSIVGKYIKPDWAPPAEVRADNPGLPKVIPGGTPGNPMGAAALTLARPEYAIHGTNRPSSIGTFASYGCIRMFNPDIMDLFQRVSFGTPVVVTP
jgi:lipoprotein-anchoring transpeptidase ErfK/SrfK